MTEPTDQNQDLIDLRLLELEDNPQAAHDTTVCNLHKELETLANDLGNPAPNDPHEAESACQRAVEQVQTLAGKPSDTIPRTGAGESSELHPNTVIGQYQILGKLGQGGMGAVYKARHAKLDKIVALKVLPEDRLEKSDAVARFEREMKAVGKIEHPHLVRALDAGVAEGLHYLVMEYVDGIDLSRLLKQHGKLPVASACELVCQAALGLQAAHERGMVHRDIKPANLMLARQEFGPPVVKVLDLGLARLADESGQLETELTTDNQIMGTLDFMAPEQAGNSKGVDTRVDVYSLGATLFTLLSGQPPYAGPAQQTIIQKLQALATQPLPSIRNLRPEVPQGLVKILEKMLAKDKNQRYDEPGEVAEALKPFAADADLAGLLEDAKTMTSTPNLAKSTAAWAIPSTDATVGLPRPRSRRPAFIATAVLLALAPVLFLYAGTIIRFATNQGELVIEIDDPNIEVQIVQNGAVVRDKTKDREFTLTAGKGEIQVLEKDGIKLATKEFQLTRGGKMTVKVTLQELADARQQPDRDAAEWVLSLGGRVIVQSDGQQQIDSATTPLPEAAFQLALVDFQNYYGRKKQGLPLNTSVVKDADLVHLEGLKKLAEINLAYQDIGDEGLMHLKNLSNLAKLDVHFTRIKGPGLAHLQGLKKLSWLNMGGLRITGPALAPLQSLPNLQTVSLGSKPTQVKDADLAYLNKIKSLKSLNLYETQISDTGLDELRDLTNLQDLDIRGTKVTAEGVADLNKALPRCRIEWNGGVVEPETPSSVPSQNYALAFDGVDDYVEVPSLKYDGMQPITIEARIACQLVRENARGDGYWESAVVASEHGHLIVTGKKSHPNRVAIAMNGFPDGAGRGPWRDDEWKSSNPSYFAPEEQMHVAFVFDGTHLRLYVNGASAGSPIAAKGRAVPRASSFTIGAAARVDETGTVSAFGRAFGGRIDEIRFSSVARYTEDFTPAKRLEPDENTLALYHFDEGQGDVLKDSSGNGHHGKIHGATWVKEVGDGKFVPYVDGDIIAAWRPTDEQKAFFDQVAKRPAEEQIEAVRKKLEEVNPGFDGKLQHKANDGQVVFLKFITDKVTQIWPVRALAHLQSLDVSGSAGKWGTERNGKLSDLSPLAGMKLTTFVCTQSALLVDLAPLKGMPLKTVVCSFSPNVSNISSLRGMPLTRLELQTCKKLKDADFAVLEDLPELTTLYLYNTGITDEGLKHLQGLTKLTDLQLGATKITDEGLAHLAQLTNLTDLNLQESHPINGTGLVYLAELPNLRHLIITVNKIADDSVERFAKLKYVEYLDIRSTKMNAEGVAAIHKSLPKCKITWDGGVVEPESEMIDHDRRVAQSVLAAGGTVQVVVGDARVGEADFDVRQIKRLEDLPSESLRVTSIHFTNVKGITDENLRDLVGLKSVYDVQLHNTKVTDAGLAHLAKLPGLQHLTLYGTQVTDAGLAQLSELPRLGSLNLSETKLVQGGMEGLRKLPWVRELHLHGRMSKSRFLELAELQNLRLLYLSNAAHVTLEDVAKFHEVNAYCRIFIDYELVGADPVREVADELKKKGATLTLGIAGQEAYQDFPPEKPLPSIRFRVRSISFYKNPSEVRDEDLSRLHAFPDLFKVDFSSTKITDAGIKHLKPCRSLVDIWLHRTQITDRSLETIADLPLLFGVHVASTNITNEGVAKLAGNHSLQNLGISATKANRDVLAITANMPQLTQLELGNLNISDEDLIQLGGMSALKYLTLKGTQVTEPGIAKLHQALPKCKITWDGGVVEPGAVVQD